MVVSIRRNKAPQQGPPLGVVLERPPEGAWAEQIAVEDLLTGAEGGRTYSRPIDPEWVDDLATNWDDNKLDVLHVSFDPEGKLVCICGNHRLTAARKRHGGKYKFWCMVYAGLTLEEEALKFHAIDQERKRHTRQDAHRSATVFKDPKALAINAVFERYGLQLSEDGRKDPTKVRAMTALYDAYEYDGPATFESAIRVIIDAWGTNAPPRGQHTINAKTIGPMVAFLWRYADLKQFDRTKLLRAMQSQDGEPYNMQRYLESMLTTQRRWQREFGGVGNGGHVRIGLQVLAYIYNRYVRRSPHLRIPERWASLSRSVVRVEKRTYVEMGVTGEPNEIDI